VTLHPGVRAFLDEVAAAGAPPLDRLSPAQARAQARRWSARNGPGPELASVEDLAVPAGDGTELRARRYEPGESEATVLWLHGGGWVTGDLETHDAMCRVLAARSGCRVLGLGYRRAPEDPFPVPLEDCFSALRWIDSQEPDRRLVVGGDSAGGNLAAACARRARDEAGPALALQVLVYPVLDHDLTTASHAQHGSGPDTFLTSQEMAWFWHHYLPDPAARGNPDASPLRAPELCGLAPTIVITAEYDPLRDEGLAYVERLRAAGVVVTHIHYHDTVHSFFSLINLIPPGREAVARAGAEIAAAVGAGVK
jgi:acetyl esterase